MIAALFIKYAISRFLESGRGTERSMCWCLCLYNFLGCSCARLAFLIDGRSPRSSLCIRKDNCLILAIIGACS
jgi:hypothetical protein